MIDVTRGNSPIVLGLPHGGRDVPAEVWEKLNETGQALADTDWHIHMLYADLGLDLTRVSTPVHRYVIDVNCAPHSAGLHLGENPDTLCPLTDFDNRPIYRVGQAPSAAEVVRRAQTYHAPYHTALSTELKRVRDIYGVAILYDCHSIRSVIPHVADETLPDFNIGTYLSTSCALSVERSVHTRCRAAFDYSCALNGRLKGGWSIRYHGQPAENIHAIQMVLAQSTYMDEAAPWTYRPDKAERLRPILYRVLSDLIDLIHERQLR